MKNILLQIIAQKLTMKMMQEVIVKRVNYQLLFLPIFCNIDIEEIYAILIRMHVYTPHYHYFCSSQRELFNNHVISLIQLENLQTLLQLIILLIQYYFDSFSLIFLHLLFLIQHIILKIISGHNKILPLFSPL